MDGIKDLRKLTSSEGFSFGKKNGELDAKRQRQFLKIMTSER